MGQANDASIGSVILRGVAASSGVALGPALRFARTTPPLATPTAAGAPEDEKRLAHQALERAAEELRALVQQVRERAGAEQADIFEAQAMMLEDPTLIDRTDELIASDQMSGRDALMKAAEEQAQTLAELPDPMWQARAADVRDAAGRAINALSPEHARAQTLADVLASQPGPVIVVADDLAPSDTASAPSDRLAGIALAQGGATSHAAILSRALGIPAVVGLGPQLLTALGDGDLVALDGRAGEITVRPDATTQATIREIQASEKSRQAAERARMVVWLTRAGATRDGARIPILANASSVAEAQAASENGAEGIGLLRTEFLFARGATLPDAEEQANLYTEIIRALAAPDDHPITIRTLDAGADKPLESLVPFTRQLPPEENPALGFRGVRLQLRFEALLLEQMEGIALAAAQTGATIHVMLPMVTTVDEIEAGRRALTEAQDRVAARGFEPRHVALGIMVETPAAALNALALARHSDFFSIGANDLAQYVMAVDRLHPDLAALQAPTQPAILRAIQLTAQAGAARHIPVAVCGEMAGEPALAALLVGLGVTELSMAPNRIPAVKAALASYRLADLRSIAERAASAENIAAADRTLADLTPLADGFSGA